MYNVIGKGIEFDPFDVDAYEAYEQKLDDMKNIENVLSGNEGAVNGMRILCDEVSNFFDDVVGEGTADILFEGKQNIRKSMDAFGEFVEQVTEEMKKYREESKIFNVSQPTNRQQRRAAERVKQ